MKMVDNPNELTGQDYINVDKMIRTIRQNWFKCSVCEKRFSGKVVEKGDFKYREIADLFIKRSSNGSDFKICKKCAKVIGILYGGVTAEDIKYFEKIVLLHKLKGHHN